MSGEEYVLRMEDIKKDYFGNKVLKGVNLKIKPGEIHALLGENGAGKSTLMNILFGMPVIHSTGGYEGEIFIGDEKVNLKSPKEAMEKGIGMVHQEFMLIPGFSITENIKLNRELTKDNLISKLFGKNLKTLDFDEMNKDSREALKITGLEIEEFIKVEGLPVGYMQFIEIAREIDKKNIKLMVFDEPTAVLTESEADKLMEAMKNIANSGIAIIFITHRLDEVMAVCNNITILRDGELVASRKVEETNAIELAQLMVGRSVERIVKDNEKEINNQEIIMSIRSLKVNMPGEKVKEVNLDIRKGEILGIGGLAGQGKIGIANGIMGLFQSEGEVFFENKPLKLNNPREILKNKIAFVAEDRRGVGLLLDKSIELNMALTAIEINNEFIKSFGLFNQIDSSKIRAHSSTLIKDLDIRCTGPQQITRRLSGGNQQKVCIARALTMNPKILFVSEPTRGIDIGAKKLVLELLVKLSNDLGMTVVITSSELAELRSICDRIAIVSEGKVAGILKPEDSDVDFGLLMSGHKNMQERGEVL
ncbi:sugar ABC transporter ATP-binding protein [uncultured Clostridium sp.]|uniref:sugar ABC transporter ATP-binding protein n=1 Tax=uncultured Clostridium sp. TaxID=59620 RepID=UPI0037DD172C